MTTNDFASMVFDLFDRYPTHQRYLATMVLWSLWKNRNSKLWDNSTTYIVTLAKDTLTKWSCMKRAKLAIQAANIPHAWSKPPWEQSNAMLTPCLSTTIQLWDMVFVLEIPQDRLCLANLIIFTLPPQSQKLKP